MRTSIVIQVLLGAGALAHPHFKLDNPLAHVHHKRQQPAKIITTTIGNQVEVIDEFVQTVYGPPSSSTPAPTTTAIVAAPEKLAVAPVNNVHYEAPKAAENVVPASITPVSITPVSVTPTPTSTPPPVQSSAAPVVSTGGSDDGAPLSGGVSILDTANKYRALMGYSSYEYNSTLAANSAKTNHDDGADVMTHELNPGSFAQCIAEVDNNAGADGLSPFELTYLAWLCEIKDARIDSLCTQMLAATNMKIDYADPGHAQILRSTTYSQIGCNYLTSTQSQTNFAGMWTCDFK